MATKYDWPAVEDRSLIGKRHDRVDGPEKARGDAKYSYDRNLSGMLFARLVTSPVPHGRIIGIDTSRAEKVKGYKGHVNILNPGDEIQWAGKEVLAIAADTEEHARDAAHAVAVNIEKLDHWVKEEDVKKARRGQPRQARQGRRQRSGPGRGLGGRRGDPRGLLRLGRHHALLPGAARPGRRLDRRRHQGLCLDASRGAHPRGSGQGALARRVDRQGRSRPGGGHHPLHGRRFRVEIQHRHLGHRLRATVEKNRQARQADARPQRRSHGRRQPAVRLRQRQGRRQERRHDRRLRVGDLVDRRHRRPRLPAVALHLR